MSMSATSAASKVSPDLKVRSRTLPVFKNRSLTRLKACPLPGLTNSFSIITAGSLSSKTFTPFLKSLVLITAILFSFQNVD